MGTKVAFKWSKRIIPSQVVHLIKVERNVDKALAIFDLATAEYANEGMEGFIDVGCHEDLWHMREVGVSTCIVSLNILIKALRKNSGTMNSGLHIFHEMPSRGYPPDSYTYGTLINGLCRFGKVTDAKSKNIDEAMKLLEEMKNNGMEPNVFTYSSLLDGLCKDGNSSEAMELLEKMNGDLLKLACMVDEMVIDGCTPNEGAWSMLLVAFWDQRMVQEAVELFQVEMMSGITGAEIDSR
ncbi:Pentatricopeptide repeat (PPR) superfamily protein isoform 2 [Hibiscus syriacus]|uniref:Pentatricopeptide repeat (PPR) superfamily protein isoform 2 n=1 Tax=Hibiscus syriacus TaxID=106335 RepID=A0A6A2WDF3_HIBSY|nr:Pentatricopeptide repeat (PPR) superfamily protein isoform 2 [Hibiscus syriacus]